MARTYGLWALFAGLCLADLWCFQPLWAPRHAQGVVERAAYGYAADEKNLTVRAMPWRFTMIPQPAFVDNATLVIPPGHPMLLRLPQGATASLHVYEARVPPLLMAGHAGGAFSMLGLHDGETVLTPVTQQAPPFSAVAALATCFDADQPVRVTLTPALVQAGRCRWTLPKTDMDLVVHASGSSSQLSLDPAASSLEIRWWLLALLSLCVAVQRLALRSWSMVPTDITATLLVLVVSKFTPVWMVLWVIKGLGGVALLVVTLVQRGHRNRGTLLLYVLTVLLAFAVVTLDRQRLGRWLTKLMDTHGASVVPTADTTHLVLGYSSANGAAVDRGAYGEGALDAVLRRTCGAADDRYARIAVDGGTRCLLVDRWLEESAGLPRLKSRVYFGGVNDDLLAPASSLAAWVGVLISAVPSREPYPQPMHAWARAASENQTAPQMEHSAHCVRALAASPAGPLTFIYDLGSYDLGVPRQFGRERLVGVLQDVVEREGGTFVDLRTLLPGESPMFYNDYVHPSEVGYRVMAEQLCRAPPGH